MRLVDKLNDALNRDVSFINLIKVCLIFVIVWLFEETSGFWVGLFNLVWQVFAPFIIGFVIAYILRGPIRFLEKHKVSKKIAIPLIYLLVILFFVWLVCSLIPVLSSRITGLINSMIVGVKWIGETMNSASHTEMPTWVNGIVQQGISALTSLKDLVPEVTNNIPALLSTAVSFIMNTIISVVVSIFLSFGWEKFRFGVGIIARRISPVVYECIFRINDEEGDYLRSLLILIGIHFVEYSFVYFIIGHPDWLIIGLLTGISLVVPYLGPTLANVIGIFTALSLPIGRVIMLLVLIMILSMTDEYVLAPIVHSHNTSVTPLWAIFSVFAGGVIFGTVGIIIAIPVYLAVRVICKMIHEKNGGVE